MSSKIEYIKDCVGEHIGGMKYREEELRNEIRVKQELLKQLEFERKNLEVGIENWLDESENV